MPRDLRATSAGGPEAARGTPRPGWHAASQFASNNYTLVGAACAACALGAVAPAAAAAAVIPTTAPEAPGGSRRHGEGHRKLNRIEDRVSEVAYAAGAGLRAALRLLPCCQSAACWACSKGEFAFNPPTKAYLLSVCVQIPLCCRGKCRYALVAGTCRATRGAPR